MRDALGHVWLPYTQMRTTPPPLPVERTEGSRIYLADGRCLIDGIASWWTACHGYNHPHIAEAVRAQLARMPHVMFGGLVHEPAVTLARRLAELLPGDLNHVFFAESGSVSVEVAMKIAVQSWLNRGEPQRTRILHFRDGYHGDTFATMAVCDPEEGMHALFRDVLTHQPLAELPRDEASIASFEDVLAREADFLAAIIVEPLVQGAGGMRFHSPAVLRRLREAADRLGVPLIFDEIFTGFGRTGTMFAMEQAGVVPDIVTLSKALTGGTLPLSACVASTALYETFLSDSPTHALMHGPTFMANPLACAAANASLDLFEQEDRLGQVRAIEAQLRAELEPCRALPGVADVRVLGAIGVVQLKESPDLRRLRQAFVADGTWIRPIRDVIYLTPALTIEPASLSQLTASARRQIPQICSTDSRSKLTPGGFSPIRTEVGPVKR
jgi:adenosylmethionine-8-amino-7-oxononanoate aminotransferase